VIRPDELTHDWNQDALRRIGDRPLLFDDETLRDGLQSPSVRNPSIEEKIRLLHLIAALGIAAADVGLPGSGARAAADAEALCREIVAARLPISPNCAARTAEEDIVPILEIMYRVGIPVEVMLFVGSSPIRFYVEGWTVEDIARRAERGVRLAVTHGAPVTFVTEDTTRSHPEVLRRLIEVAVRSGAQRICIADTVGHATPIGAFRISRFVRRVVDAAGGADVGLDWHGHNDRGLAVATALSAARAGVDRLHGTALGVGERVGNPPMELLLVNARLLGWADPDLSHLADYACHAATILGVELPRRTPVVGADAFRTSTGVHAAAIRKALATGDREIVDLVYSSVPASWVGREQEIEIGPMSGMNNVRFWLAAHGYPEDDEVLNRVFAAAKEARRVLSDEELHALAAGES
jgi:2-isopropylmalate synthase